MAGAAGFALPADPPAASIRAEARVGLASPACRRLALAFFLYAALYFVVSGFLPELLVGRFGLTLATANLVAAAAIGANAAGNLAASALIARGVSPRRTMAAAFAALVIAAAPLFAGAAPALSLAAAFFALGIGGLCPASIFASLAGAAPRAALMPATGLLMQASHLGQFAGPAIAGFVVERWGWAAIAAPVGATAAAGLALVALTRPRP
ncbi:MAG: MFS transporter, partial [Methylobacteriaceae bacterium]|nr:MFS transporter [Methylobacteriaceae bacterium]